ncbi:hypothetical protein GP486_004314 [Trichoglossum hirsutum]|uniref:Uncharacterized protein n=1 Tax=Trichoglossum hirsutum TaxID=265104 RepID=A0A9P8LB82_9PEZI|nr:hypothetical protein GP486_004314 [Trichoglossum hirsutum]
MPRTCMKMHDVAAMQSLLVSSAAFDLQLAVTSRTLLSGSLPSAFLSSAAAEREIWFSRGIGFCLSLRLLVNGRHVHADDPRYGNVIEGFAKTLRDAELWTQLRLHASLVLPSDDRHNPDSRHQKDIVINLDHSRTDGDMPGSPQQASRFSSFPFANVSPPQGVPSASIEEVNLTLAFSTNTGDQTSQHRTPKRSKTVPDVVNNETGPVSELLDGGIGWLYYSQPTASTRYGGDLGLHIDLEEALTSAHLTQLNSMPSPVQLLQTPQGPPGQNPRKRAAGVLQSVLDESASYLLNECPELEHMVLLADAALRNLVTEKPLRIPPGVVVVDSAPRPRLSEAISMRSHFLTVISRAISFPIYAHARSSTLKSKLERLSSLPPSPLMYSPPSSVLELSHGVLHDLSTSAAIHHVVQARLWRMMQQGLYDPNAARRLEPVKLFGGSEIASLENYPNGILRENGQDKSDLEHEILPEDQVIDSSTPRPNTPGDYSDGSMLATFLEYGDGLPFEQGDWAALSRHGTPTSRKCHTQSMIGGESDRLFDSDRALLEAPTIGVYTETQPIMDERQGLLYGANLFSATGLGPAVRDSSLRFQENSQLILIEDGLNCAAVKTLQPHCDASSCGITKPNTLTNDSLRVIQGEGQLLFVEDDFLFSKENLACHQEQYDDCTKDEMLF